MSTILVVDDDDQLRKSFHKLLTEEGYTVLTAASGEAGLRGGASGRWTSGSRDASGGWAVDCRAGSDWFSV